MTPASFPRANAAAPPPANAGKDAAGQSIPYAGFGRVALSAWRPNPAEIERILAGGLVTLTIMSDTGDHPGVVVGVARASDLELDCPACAG